MSYTKEYNTPDSYYETEFDDVDDWASEFKYHYGQLQDHLEALVLANKEAEIEYNKIIYHLKQLNHYV